MMNIKKGVEKMSRFILDTEFCKQCGFDGALCDGCIKKKCYKQGRVDAINALVRLVCEYYTMQERAGYCADTNNMIKQRIADFGEQLKE